MPTDAPPYAFRDPALLRLALTVPAAMRREPDNQRLEFLGDSVLGLLVAERLYRAHPELDEGGLSIWRDALVSTRGLAARLSRLGPWFEHGLDWGQSVYNRPEKAKVDACEAVIGAAWLDGGRNAVEAILSRLYAKGDFAKPPVALRTGTDASHGVDANPKGRLVQYAQINHTEPPLYTRLGMSGPSHEPTFTVAVRLDGREARGEGPSLKKAEIAAAAAWLAQHEPKKADTP
ncbi:MAG TPA: ribonuclease III [Candidatus Spyradenecus faecavium]|uniref:Ribonuclease III n=1 Tax=Candidatus Spyradenecus faecavium TaxID=2840947 RepID=A0A9D1NNI1_9BACT|nr:ribonuclease III [Candidatus Spyradenecus faecavium]